MSGCRIRSVTCVTGDRHATYYMFADWKICISYLYIEESIRSINRSVLSLCGSQGTRGDPGDRTREGAGGGDSGTPAPQLVRSDSLVLSESLVLPRKEVIQPHVPVRLPCYDFTPLTLHTFGASPQTVGPATSGADDSGGVTGGVYKARERIHRGMLIRDY